MTTDTNARVDQPTDLLARAREMAARELEALRPERKRRRKDTLLTGFEPAPFEVLPPQTTLSVQG